MSACSARRHSSPRASAEAAIGAENPATSETHPVINPQVGPKGPAGENALPLTKEDIVALASDSYCGIEALYRNISSRCLLKSASKSEVKTHACDGDRRGVRSKYSDGFCGSKSRAGCH